ncbi:YbaB/EbfC family nucleoid-associated protein [Spirillospora sp. NBC_00431]
MATEYERVRGSAPNLRERIDGVRETAESDDGRIAATVDGRGKLVDLHLDPRVFRQEDPTTLAKDILETASQATVLVRRRLIEFTRHLLPPDADPRTVDPAFDPVLHALDRKITGDSRG